MIRASIMLTLLCLITACSRAEQRTVWGEQFEVVLDRSDSEALRLDRPDLFIEFSIIRDVQPKIQQRIVDEKIQLFGSTFREVRTGYPGQITTRIVCPEQYRPTYEERPVPGGRARFHQAWANRNGVIGACTEDTVFYRAAQGHLQCDSGGLVQWSIRVPATAQETLNSILDRLNCAL